MNKTEKAWLTIGMFFGVAGLFLAPMFAGVIVWLLCYQIAITANHRRKTRPSMSVVKPEKKLTLDERLAKDLNHLRWTIGQSLWLDKLTKEQFEDLFGFGITRALYEAHLRKMLPTTVSLPQRQIEFQIEVQETDT